jgi:LysR family carnitine catabolism transcriptional activator
VAVLSFSGLAFLVRILTQDYPFVKLRVFIHSVVLLMQISDRVLQTFLVLAEVQKFTVAAEKCNMTQSALSQLIARLEQRIGVRLFERGTRSVRLTPEGERLAISAKRITNELENALIDLQAIATLESGQVSIAVIPSLAAFWIPQILHKYREKFPRIRIHLHDVSSARCHDLVRKGLVDFSLSSQPGFPGEVDAELLFEEMLYIACPASHPLAKRKALGLADLRGLEVVHLLGTNRMLVRAGNDIRQTKQVLIDSGVVDSGLEVEHMSTLAGLVAAGLGACLMPEFSLPQFSSARIRTVKLKRDAMVRPIYFSKPKGAGLSLAASEFKKLVETQRDQA